MSLRHRRLAIMLKVGFGLKRVLTVNAVITGASIMIGGITAASVLSFLRLPAGVGSQFKSR